MSERDDQRLRKGLRALACPDGISKEAQIEQVKDAIVALQSTEDPSPEFRETHDRLCALLDSLLAEP